MHILFSISTRLSVVDLTFAQMFTAHRMTGTLLIAGRVFQQPLKKSNIIICRPIPVLSVVRLFGLCGSAASAALAAFVAADLLIRLAVTSHMILRPDYHGI
jgi:hypothetical protein